MGACCSSPDKADPAQDFIVDVEKILSDHVWEVYKDNRTKRQKVCLRRKDYIIEVPMNYFHFDSIDEDVRRRQKSAAAAASSSASAPETVPSSQHTPSTHMMAPYMTDDPGDSAERSKSHVMVINTDFTNNTETDQTYMFEFEKTRKASLNVTFQRGFTVGGKVNFTIGLPSNKAGGETDMRVTVSKATEEVIEETLRWVAQSEIKVPKGFNYTAKVMLTEAPVSYTFTLWTKMSMPTGGAPATVTRKKGGSGKSYTHVIDNLKRIFDGYKIVDSFVPKVVDQSLTYPAVIFKTTGIVDGVRLSDQKILLNGVKLDERCTSSQGPHGEGPSVNNNALNMDGSPQDGGQGSIMTAPGRMLARAPSSSSPSAASPPIIEEVPEEDGGVGEGSGTPSTSLPFQLLVAPGCDGQGNLGTSGLTTTTTTSSPTSASLAPSPVSQSSPVSPG